MQRLMSKMSKLCEGALMTIDALENIKFVNQNCKTLVCLN